MQESRKPLKPSKSGKPKIRASHILIKHCNSVRTKSWRDRRGRYIKKRTVEAAITILQRLRDEIKGFHGVDCEKFSKIARTFSDCPTAEFSGDVGTFPRGRMQPAFEEAAWDLEIGELSRIVHTDSGVHIVLRTA